MVASRLARLKAHRFDRAHRLNDPKALAGRNSAQAVADSRIEQTNVTGADIERHALALGEVESLHRENLYPLPSEFHMDDARGACCLNAIHFRLQHLVSGLTYPDTLVA